jgi:signal transduction histidine kinase
VALDGWRIPKETAMPNTIYRTGVAAALTVAALACPLSAWYVTGQREARREAALIAEEPARAAQDAAKGLAAKLAARIDALRESENRRPFYQYRNLYHDPKAAANGPAIVQSPLAEGPLDPLIRAYFQIDPKGQLTLPNVNDEMPELTERNPNQAEQKKIQRDFRDNVGQLFSDIQNRHRGGKGQSASPAPAPKDRPQQPMSQSAPQMQTVVVDEQDLQYDAMAPRLYQEYRQQRVNPRHPPEPNREPTPSSRSAQQIVSQPPQGQQMFNAVTIRVSPLQWNTLEVGGAPALVALRDVNLPSGVLTQGFEISRQDVEDWLRSPLMPVRLLPGPPRGGAEARVPIEGTDWRVVVDATAASADARGRARELVSRFRRIFLLIASMTALAGLLVVGFVWQAERLARQRSRFAASAAHELRTPLAGLRMYGEMLAEGLGDPARSKEYARRLASEAERLGRVVANVLGFSRLERGILSIRPEPGDLGASVRECVERQRPALEAAGARVDLDVPDALPPVRFDRDALAQILQNLLDNAEKYARGASDRTIRVTLATASRATGDAKAGTGTPEQGMGNAITLVVSDRGPGIPPDIRRKLFRPFERGVDADAPAGLGLGLTLARTLARAQGGDVAYADAPGGGAAFTVTLPAA